MKCSFAPSFSLVVQSHAWSQLRTCRPQGVHADLPDANVKVKQISTQIQSWPWASYLSPFCCSLLVCKMGVIRVPALWCWCEDRTLLWSVPQVLITMSCSTGSDLQGLSGRWVVMPRFIHSFFFIHLCQADIKARIHRIRQGSSSLKKKSIDFREEEEGGERKTLICCSTYLCIHWLFLVCALTRDRIHSPGVSGWCSNQLSYPARARLLLLNCSQFGRDLSNGCVTVGKAFWGEAVLKVVKSTGFL